MAQTYFATNDASAVKLWEQGARMEMENDSVFGKYGAEDGSLPIEINRDMTGKKGDSITTTLLYDLDDTKVYTSTQTIEGKEQKMVAKDFSVSLEDYDMPVSAGSKMSNQRVLFEIGDKAEKLVKKAGKRRLDRYFMEEMTGVSTTETVVAASDFTKIVGPTAAVDAAATNLAKIQALTTADTMNLRQIAGAKLFAKTGGYVLSTGLRAQPKFTPIPGASTSGFICFIHPAVAEDMKQDDEIAELLRESAVRGPSNPLFNGASFELDGVAFVESDLVPTRLTGGSGSVPVAYNFLVGAQAFFWAWGQELQVFMYKTDAYGRFLNYSLNYMKGSGKTKYNSLDFATIGMPCAFVNRASGVSAS